MKIVSEELTMWRDIRAEQHLVREELIVEVVVVIITVIVLVVVVIVTETVVDLETEQ